MRARLILALAVLAAAPLAQADDGLRRCRALADAAARLACYDALPLTAAPAAAPAAVAPAAPARPEAGFGLPASATRAEPEAIESTIPGFFEGWDPGSRITLANGQVWQISDGSRGVFRLRDPKVRIRKGTFGSFFLEIDGENLTPRVRRVQ